MINIEPQTPVSGDIKVNMLYDYMDRRVEKKVFTHNYTDWIEQYTKHFLCDGWNLVKESTTENSTTTATYYTWGLDLSQSLQGAGGIGGLIATVSDSDTNYHCYDLNGNKTQLLDETDGSITAHVEYDPFGNEVTSYGLSSADAPFRFSTKYHDPEYDLYYYGFRYYVADIGRWLTRDPIGEESDYNLYEYCKNTSVFIIDPDGRFSIYAHTKSAGHVGVQTNENGKLRNWDLGRYKGAYKKGVHQIRKYMGPNILQVTSGKPYCSGYQGFIIHEFEISKELDNIIADKFKDKFDSGSSTFPEKVKQDLPKGRTKLASYQRYMGSDWGLTGPNCVVFSFNTIEEALDDVIFGTGHKFKLKCEALETKGKVRSFRGVAPIEVKYRIDFAEWVEEIFE